MAVHLTHDTPCWAIVPAAGIGSRMGSELPKQYLSLAGKTVIEHSIARLLSLKNVCGIVVSLAKNDQWWHKLKIASDKKITLASGGDERCHSVLNALETLGKYASDDDWVLVHDAARPCVDREDIRKLVGRVIETKSLGGILGMSVRDTMKRTDGENHVKETISRVALWHAYTPQLFNLKLLQNAMQSAISNGLVVTDEASAMEAAGYQPLMVEGQASNIKITHPSDLKLAEFFLSQTS